MKNKRKRENKNYSCPKCPITNVFLVILYTIIPLTTVLTTEHNI